MITLKQLDPNKVKEIEAKLEKLGYHLWQTWYKIADIAGSTPFRKDWVSPKDSQTKEWQWKKDSPRKNYWFLIDWYMDNDAGEQYPVFTLHLYGDTWEQTLTPRKTNHCRSAHFNMEVTEIMECDLVRLPLFEKMLMRTLAEQNKQAKKLAMKRHYPYK